MADVHLELAVDVVMMSRQMGHEAPKKTQFYYHFAGTIQANEEIKGLFEWDGIFEVSNRQWQEAKEIVYGDLFDFKSIL